MPRSPPSYGAKKRARRKLEYLKDYNKTKRANQSFYNSYRWQKTRKLYLKLYPLCRGCEKAGRVKIAELVDHIIPIGAGGDPLAGNNLQSLCNECHGIKTKKDKKIYSIPAS